MTSESNEGRRPIKVRFEIPYYTTSGIQVCYIFVLLYGYEFRIQDLIRIAI